MHIRSLNNKEAMNVQTVSSVVLRELDSHKQENEAGPYLTPYINISSKYMRPGTLKLLEKNRGSELLNIDLSNDFWDLTPKATKVKQR